MKKPIKILLILALVLATAAVSSLITIHLTKLTAPVMPNVQTAASAKEEAVPVKPAETEQEALQAVGQKMREINDYLEAYFIDEYDPAEVNGAAADGAAAAMVAATGDEWSYYISAKDMQAHTEQSENAYVGVGVTIQLVDQGVEITDVTKGGPADAAGIRPGDIITHVDGQSTVELGVSGTQGVVRGEVGTDVHFTVLRGKDVMEMDLTRAQILAIVAESQMLEGQIGYVTIDNFDQHCAEQTLQCVHDLVEQGAKAILFDVRFNPGGLKTELVQVLDALLPEGPLFRSVDYAGQEEVIMSDSARLPLPMAVLVNEDSFSAAEFFAAALQEYDAAEIVGTKTYGKGNFQVTLPLSDGSAVAISVGKYCTPEGVSLTGVGVTPDVEVDLEYEDYLSLYYGTLEQEDDDQLQEAVEVLLAKIS